MSFAGICATHIEISALDAYIKRFYYYMLQTRSRTFVSSGANVQNVYHRNFSSEDIFFLGALSSLLEMCVCFINLFKVSNDRAAATLVFLARLKSVVQSRLFPKKQQARFRLGQHGITTFADHLTNYTTNNHHLESGIYSRNQGAKSKTWQQAGSCREIDSVVVNWQ